MSGSMTDNDVAIDYVEAFVRTMEMHAHGPNCKQCVLAGTHNKPENFCAKMQSLREYLNRAYVELPPEYKQRYQTALESAVRFATQAINDMAKL